MSLPARPRADTLFGLAWTGLGLAIAIGSWRMDRLESQGIEPYSAPGLVPGMLGAILAVFGLVLTLRRPPPIPAADGPPEEAASAGGVAEPWRIGLALLLCLGFGLGLLGHGPPFWLAAFGFVFLAILLFEWPDRRREGTLARGALLALAVAAGASAAITAVFQELFLVRLP